MLRNLPSSTINVCAEHRKRERAIIFLVFWIHNTKLGPYGSVSRQFRRVIYATIPSKKISNDQELIQSDPTNFVFNDHIIVVLLAVIAI